ncbi:hypothetical protein ACO0QE_003483 [Hanseniaspora vineae]
MSLVYDTNTKLISSNVYTTTSIDQINTLTRNLVENGQQSLLKITPEPNAKSTGLIKSMFEKSVTSLTKNKNIEESYKYAKLAVEMAVKSRSLIESFQVQMQELQFILKHKVDVILALYQKNYSKTSELLVNGKKLTKIEFIRTPESQDLLIEALQDIEMLLNTGLIADPNLSLRKCDVLMKLTKFRDAKMEAERGLSLFTVKVQNKEFVQSIPQEQRPAFMQLSMKLKSLFAVAERYVKEENGDF